MADRDAVVNSYPLQEPGLWVERIGTSVFPVGTPALFLDRDGTINVDTGYLSDPADIALRDDIVPAIEAANRRKIPVVVVTNQSGIARGFYGWDDFADVNGRVLDLLRASNGLVDMVVACAYHEAGAGPLAIADHPMRKPNPGMLFEAAKRLGIDLKRSLIVGDKPADMDAGRRAGVSRGWLVDGEASDQAGFRTMRLCDRNDLAGLLAAIEAF
jgi:D-glycero-D-manno-heptose 1,7-bisphosphate phosphatase